MESTFKTWKTGRRQLSEIFGRVSLAQLNKVPNGFNNNLIWNMGHVIVTQQTLIYGLSELPGNIPFELNELYKPGTRPSKEVSAQEAQQLKGLLLS